MLIETKTYVVSNGRSYLGFDSNSGGYPYASRGIADTTKDISKALSWLDDAKGSYCQIPTAKVYEIVLREVDITSYTQDQDIVEQLLAGITEQQRILLKDRLK
jgi:hypothetical protein